MEMKALLYYRSKLDAHDRDIYDSLVSQWMHFYTDIHVSCPHCDFSQISRFIHYDYPLLFYVNYYSISYSICGGVMNIKGDYLYSKSEAEKLLQKCEQWGMHIYSHLPHGLGNPEKALWLHDVILNNVRYGESNGISAHNMIGVVQDGLSVCEGIGMAYKFLCDYAGIPCIYISGSLNGCPHGWNMLWINNESSFVDVTNDINALPGNFGRSNFLRSSNEMHGYIWDTELIPLCRLTNKSNPYIVVHSRKELIDSISEIKAFDEVRIHLEFSYPLPENEIQSLIGLCTLRCPILRGKEISFSVERQMLIIKTDRP